MAHGMIDEPCWVKIQPFQSVWTTQEMLAAAFSVPLVGMGLIAIAWGFFEGFKLCGNLPEDQPDFSFPQSMAQLGRYHPCMHVYFGSRCTALR